MDASHKNEKNVANTNRLNKQQFNQARGSLGNATLPLYLKTAEGTPWERDVLGQDLMDIYDATSALGPQAEMDKYAAEGEKTRAMKDASDEAAAGIFNGDTTRKLLENQAPVGAARVQMTKQAAMDALEATLADISATQAKQGFSGDGLSRRMLELKARRDANTQGAGAELENQMEQRSIRDMGVQLPLQNLDLPYAMARRNIDQLHLPEDAYLDQVGRRLQPLTFVRIGGGQPFQYQAMPTIQPSAGLGGALIQGAGQAAQSYFRNRQQVQAQQAYQNAQRDMMVNRSMGTYAPAYSPGDFQYAGGGYTNTGGYIGDVNMGGVGGSGYGGGGFEGGGGGWEAADAAMMA